MEPNENEELIEEEPPEEPIEEGPEPPEEPILPTPLAMRSILQDIKKMLGIQKDFDYFDEELVLHINSAFFVLTQLGVGPEKGFSIVDDSEVWADFFQDQKEDDLQAVKSYIYFKTRIAFDPPQTSYLIDNFKKQAEELEWRLNVKVEGMCEEDPDDSLIEEEGEEEPSDSELIKEWKRERQGERKRRFK